MVRRDFIVAGALALWGAAPALAQSGGKKPTRAPVILVVGDSLSAEYGLPRGTGWVALLDKRLAQEKIPATVVNASVSGDTTAGGRARLAALLQQHRPTHVVIELGGNDANYTRQFAEVFENVAQERKAALVPFLLKGVADGPDPTALFQPDRIHPTAQAHPRMLDNVWPALRALL